MKFILDGRIRLTSLENNIILKKFCIDIILFVSVLISCKVDNVKRNWPGGAIKSPGTYIHKQIIVNVKLEKGFVKYSLSDSLGNVILSSNENISMYQNWALFLDESESLWVLSSDIGNGWWKKDSKTLHYSYIKIDHLFDQRKIPKSVYSEMRQFF